MVAKLLPLAEQVLSDPKADVERLQAALQTYAMAGKTARMEDSLNQLVRLDPTRPELWYDLGAILCFQSKTNAALIAVSNAVWHSEVRLRTSPSAWDLRRMAETDARFNALRPLPEFKLLVAPKP